MSDSDIKVFQQEPKKLWGKPPTPLRKKDKKLALRLIEKVAEGETIAKLLIKEDGSKRANLPSRRTFHYWLERDPELRALYAEARELSAYALEEEAIIEARELVRGNPSGDSVRATAELLKQLRWSAEKRNHTNFGSRPLVAPATTVQIFTTLDLGQEGAASGPGPSGTSPYEIEVPYREVEAEAADAETEKG